MSVTFKGRILGILILFKKLLTIDSAMYSEMYSGFDFDYDYDLV